MDTQHADIFRLPPKRAHPTLSLLTHTHTCSPPQDPNKELLRVYSVPSDAFATAPADGEEDEGPGGLDLGDLSAGAGAAVPAGTSDAAGGDAEDV